MVWIGFPGDPIPRITVNPCVWDCVSFIYGIQLDMVSSENPLAHFSATPLFLPTAAEAITTAAASASTADLRWMTAVYTPPT